MLIDIFSIIFFTSFVQSIFGTGILLFGTPLMLLSGYSFFVSLSILLPTSLLISFLQIVKNKENVDINFIKRVLIFSVPLIVIFLVLRNYLSFNGNIFVALFLVIFSLRDLIPSANYTIQRSMKNESFFLMVMGIVHGLTNLGGALLSAIVFNQNSSKITKRSTIASAYLVFAIFQLVTLYYIEQNFIFGKINLLYWMVGLFTFYFCDKFIFLKISDTKFEFLSKIFLFVMGTALFIKTLV